jgi:hypothetical protein
MPVRMLPFRVPDTDRLAELDAELAASPLVTIGEVAILRVYRQMYREKQRPKGFSKIRRWARAIRRR